MSLLVFILIGAAAGWLAGNSMKGRGFGLLGNSLVGIVGAVVGGFLFDLFGIDAEGMIGSLITAVVGAIILLYIVDFITDKKS